jgi:hypothetical protein
MPKKPLPLRIDEDLLRRVDGARGDVSRTRFVERALERALGVSGSASPAVAAATPAPSRASKARDELAMERQRKLNERKS